MQAISRQVQLFVPTVIASAALALMILSDQVSWHDWEQLLVYFAVAVVAFSVRIPDPRGGAVTPSTVLSYLAMYTFNPPTALLVVGAGRTVGYIVARGWIPWRALFNGALMALSVAIGAHVFRLLGGVSARADLAASLPAMVAGSLAHQVANHFFVSYAVSRERGTPFLNTWFVGIRDFLWPSLFNIPSAALLAVLYNRIHHATILAYLAVLPLQWMALRLYIKRRQLYAQIVDGLVAATDVNFPLGQGHSRRVADYSVAIAREMRLSEPEVESVQFAALLHDVGMIGKDDLLERPLRTLEDAESLRDHVRVGAEVAREHPRKEIATLILRHHERYDGTGYPGGLSGESIPVGARIIALAETIDSMASGTYPYTAPLSVAAIVAHANSEKGRAFDPEIVHAFLRALERGAVSLTPSNPREQGVPRMPGLRESPAR